MNVKQVEETRGTLWLFLPAGATLRRVEEREEEETHKERSLCLLTPREDPWSRGWFSVGAVRPLDGGERGTVNCVMQIKLFPIPGPGHACRLGAPPMCFPFSSPAVPHPPCEGTMEARRLSFPACLARYRAPWSQHGERAVRPVRTTAVMR